MSWIKRNLFFVVGSLVALVFLGGAGLYLFSKWNYNKQKLEELTAAYAELDRLNQLNLGSPKLDVIKTLQEQRDQIQALIRKYREHFAPIPAIPDSRRVTSKEFADALSQTVDQLQRDAATASVVIQPKYSFSFQAERSQVRFAQETLHPLAAQLGEIKAICDVLFRAKVNSLDNIRRERVSEHDMSGAQSDYLEERSVTTEFAVVTPYEVAIHGFSGEIAGVLDGFATAPYGFVVKSINVEPAGENPSAPMAQYVPPPAAMVNVAPVPIGNRYGLASGAPPPVMPPAATGPATAPGPRGGLPVLLNEKPLRITIGLNIVKLLPKK